MTIPIRYNDIYHPQILQNYILNYGHIAKVINEYSFNCTKITDHEILKIRKYRTKKSMFVYNWQTSFLLIAYLL